MLSPSVIATASATAAPRRRVLIEAMEGEAARGVTCVGCAGTCCTFVANSMQITALEALDVWTALTASMAAPDVASLKEALAQSARDQGLDRPAAGDGKRSFSRRRYTCPLFQGRELGCPLPATAKPYGCLAFNPVKDGAKATDCASGPGLLERRAAESATTEAKLLDQLSGLGASRELKAIPVALLEVAAL